jgi:hypothetical protein
MDALRRNRSTQAATAKRVLGKRRRWAEEMRSAGWIVEEPRSSLEQQRSWAEELRSAGWTVEEPPSSTEEQSYSLRFLP